jgi:hypothetical protein
VGCFSDSYPGAVNPKGVARHNQSFQRCIPSLIESFGEMSRTLAGADDYRSATGFRRQVSLNDPPRIGGFNGRHVQGCEIRLRIRMTHDRQPRLIRIEFVMDRAVIP